MQRKKSLRTRKSKIIQYARVFKKAAAVDDAPMKAETDENKSAFDEEDQNHSYSKNRQKIRKGITTRQHRVSKLPKKDKEPVSVEECERGSKFWGKTI